MPYFGISNAEVIEKVVGGYRMSSPDDCPQKIYEWMLACWNVEAEQRPSFKQLYDEIEKIWLETRHNQPSSSIPSEVHHQSNVQAPLTVEYEV